MTGLQEAFSLVLDPYVILVLLLSSVFGLVVGALPGLTATMAVPLLVAITLFIEPVPAIGGLFGAAVLAFSAPALAEFALRFSSEEYFWLACFGLSCAVFISTEAPIKGVVSLLIGLFIATIGIDVTAGYPRFTFGSVELMGGVSFIPAMIGMFAISEVLRYVASTHERKPMAQQRIG